MIVNRLDLIKNIKHDNFDWVKKNLMICENDNYYKLSLETYLFDILIFNKELLDLRNKSMIYFISFITGNKDYYIDLNDLIVLRYQDFNLVQLLKKWNIQLKSEIEENTFVVIKDSVTFCLFINKIRKEISIDENCSRIENAALEIFIGQFLRSSMFDDEKL